MKSQGPLDPSRWDRYVVPKRRQRITTRRCVTPQKSADLTSIAAEACNHGCFFHLQSTPFDTHSYIVTHPTHSTRRSTACREDKLRPQTIGGLGQDLKLLNTSRQVYRTLTCPVKGKRTQRTTGTADSCCSFFYMRWDPSRDHSTTCKSKQ
jgi:hypothetical protein